MSTTYRVGYLVGSLSSTSINRALSLALKRLGAQAGLELAEIPIQPLPFYSADMDGEYPEVANRSRRPSPTPTPSSSSRPSTTARCPAC